MCLYCRYILVIPIIECCATSDLYLFAQYCLTDEPELRPLVVAQACVTEYPITRMQPIYYVAESFEDAKEQVL